MNDGRITTQENFSDDEIELINMFTQEAAAMPAPSVTKADVLARAQREARSSGSSNGRATTIGRGFAVAASLAVLAGGAYLGTRGSDTTPVIPATPSTTSSTVVDAPAVSPTDYLVATIRTANGGTRVDLVNATDGNVVRTLQRVQPGSDDIQTMYDTLRSARVASDGTVYAIARATEIEPEGPGTAPRNTEVLTAVDVTGQMRPVADNVDSFQLLNDGRNAVIVTSKTVGAKTFTRMSSLEILDLTTGRREVVRTASWELPTALDGAETQVRPYVAGVTPDDKMALITSEFGDSVESALVSLDDRNLEASSDLSVSLLTESDQRFLSSGPMQLIEPIVNADGSTLYVSRAITYDKVFVDVYAAFGERQPVLNLENDQLPPLSQILETEFPLDEIISSRDGRATLVLKPASAEGEILASYDPEVHIVSALKARSLTIGLAAGESLLGVSW